MAVGLREWRAGILLGYLDRFLGWFFWIFMIYCFQVCSG